MNEMEPYLIHYGIPRRSGRYPYGSGNRPFQSSGGKVGFLKRNKTAVKVKSESSEKKLFWKGQKKKEAPTNKIADNLQRARDAVEEKRNYEAEKERAIKEGSASDVMKFKGDLTNQQLQDALTRIRLENQLSDISNKEIKRGMDKIDQVMKDIQTISNWGKIGTDTWNLLASVYNSTPEGQQNPWPIIKKG